MKFLLYLLCFACASLLVACDRFPEEKKDESVVITVGNTKLHEADIYRMVPEWNLLDDQAKLTFLKHWVDEEVIYQEAVKNGVLDDPLLLTQLEQTGRKMVVDYFLQRFSDTVTISDAEKLEFYQNNQELYVRGQTLVSGAILYFKDWASADAYYAANKAKNFTKPPRTDSTLYKVVTFDSVAVTPDSCVLPSIATMKLNKITVMKACKGSVRIGVAFSRLDSAEVTPYASVADDVASRAWDARHKKVMEDLKKEWKSSLPIFSKNNLFSEKEQ